MELFSESVPQEHPMGCAVACVAFACGKTYGDALNAFLHPEHAWTRGFYCEEIVEALRRLGRNYEFTRFNKLELESGLSVPGTIIFVESCEQYPNGHFFARGKAGWMNPWTTFPSMIPIKASEQENLPGPIGYIVYEI